MKRFMVKIEKTEVNLQPIKAKIESLGFVRCSDDDDCSFPPSCIRTYDNGTYTLYRHKAWGHGEKLVINFEYFLSM